MVQNELNFGGKGGVVEASTEGFKVFRMPRSDRGVARGPRKRKRTVKRGPGRPRVYDGQDRRVVAAALRKYGITGARKFLRKERKLKVSVTLCRQVAEAEGITFKRERPAA